MKKAFLFFLLIPFFSYAQVVTQGICTRSAGDVFTLNGISQNPYAGRFFCTAPVNLNNNFDLRFNAYLGNIFNNGMAFLFIPGTQPTATNPPVVISTDNIHNFGTGSITSDFVIEFDIRGSFCAAGQNTNYEPTTDINHISYWRNNSSCTFGNYYSPYSALGTVNYYAYEPYRIRWTKSTNTLETYYNNVLIKSNVVDLVGLLGTTVYWGFSAGCYCVTGGPVITDMTLNGTKVLPLSLTDFDAEAKDNAVQLQWRTGYEQNTSHFILERSGDGIQFSPLQRIAATGNSTLPLNYKAIDQEPLSGTVFYRLKMLDTDGRFSYSKILAVKMNALAKKAIIFPNPVSSELHVQVPAVKKGKCTLQVIDGLGRVLKQQQVQLNNNPLSFTINIQDLQPGVYWLQVQYTDGRDTQKIVKQ
jgi:hypothetical protein